jgi:ABC-type multidrug transport system fused ATPase/permease subunit
MLRSALFMAVSYVPRIIEGRPGVLFQDVPACLPCAANVSLGRVQDFLNEVCRPVHSSCAVRLINQQTELLNQYADNAIAQDASAEHVNDIGLAQASFAWHKERNTDGMRTPSRQVFRLRIGDEVVFTKGCVNLIIGPTGCGKSSLLHALLGEMDYVPSGSGSWVNLPRGGGVAYWYACLLC